MATAGRFNDELTDALVMSKVCEVPRLKIKFYNIYLSLLGPDAMERLEDQVAERMTLMDNITGLLLGECNRPTLTRRILIVEETVIDEAGVGRAADYVFAKRAFFFTMFRIEAKSHFRKLDDDFNGRLKLLNHIFSLWGFACIASNIVDGSRVFSIACNVDGVTLSDIYRKASKDIYDLDPELDREARDVSSDFRFVEELTRIISGV